MRPLQAHELLQVWDEGIHRSMLQKTLHLLGTACDVSDYREMGKMSIGERDARLLKLRVWMFGHTLKSMTTCPHCSTVIEWENDANNIHLQAVPDELVVKTFKLEQDGYKISFRLPNSNDVMNILSEANNSFHKKKLLEDCILDVSSGANEHSAVSELPDNIWDTLETAMSEHDPQADIRIQVHCLCCHHEWEVPFDIMSFLWAEIDHWAKRIIKEVAILAGAFGWSEKDILQMSAQRRKMYIDMLYQ